MVMPGVIGCIAQEGQAATGPTQVSIATSSAFSGSGYDNACLIYRVGMSAQVFEDGVGFSGGAVNATIPADFSVDRDRSIAFGAFGRGVTSGGSLTYTWVLTEDSAFPTGVFQSSVAENTAQDLTTVDVNSPPDGYPDTTTGIGPYIKFNSAPSSGDSGEYTLELKVTDSNGQTTAQSLDIYMEFA